MFAPEHLKHYIHYYNMQHATHTLIFTEVGKPDNPEKTTHGKEENNTSFHIWFLQGSNSDPNLSFRTSESVSSRRQTDVSEASTNLVVVDIFVLLVSGKS